jgi:hypothetical protein
LFFNQTTRRRVKAAALRNGTHLRTPDGAAATVIGGSIPRHHTGWMWDLTIPTDHDFYIQTAATAILVHNEVCRDLPSPFGKDTYAVIGRRPDINAARPWDNHEVLTLNKWSVDRNDEWIQGIIAKGQKVYLASPINDISLFDPATSGPYGQTLFAREINQQTPYSGTRCPRLPGDLDPVVRPKVAQAAGFPLTAPRRNPMPWALGVWVSVRVSWFW